MSRYIIYLILFSVLFSQTTYNLYSPEIDLPAISDEETIHFGFWINIDMPDYSQIDNPSTPDVDESDYLADYYNIAISDVGSSAWHSSDYNIDNGNNFWCADKEVSGYMDGWIQYLDTPSISVGNGGEFSSRIYYDIEDATGPFVDGSCTDGWDAANIRISLDGGSTWVLLEDPLNPYHFDCGYGWIYNDSKYDIDGSLNHLAKGWGGNSNIWVDFSADLSQYSGQDIIVRFAFGSDPELSTADDSSLTGFHVDNIIVEDETGVLFSDSGDNMSQMIASGEVWVDQFYDYGSCSAESPRPGCDEWEEYLPGDPFNEGANVLLNISDYAEKTVQFRIQTNYDDNHDGGQGEGLFIDDFKIYTFYSAVYYIPTDLNADPGNGEVVLTWEDMNASGTDDFDYSSDTFDDTLYTTSGTGWSGAIFDILGASTINTISIYNINADTTITIGAFSNLGATYDTDPKYQMEVALTTGWNDIIVPNWEMQNDFIIAHQFNESFGAIFSTATYNTGDEIELHSRFRTSSTWEMPLWLLSEDDVMTGEILTGEFSIRANITYEGADVTYNVYRDDNLDNIQEMTKIKSELTANTYTDSTVVNNVTYKYAVSATYPDEGESSPSAPVSATPMSSTVHELYHDDGSSESEFNAGVGNFSAVKFTASESGEEIARIRWYQNGSGGVFYIKVFEDDNGMPGAETYSAVQASGNMDGWNEKDLSQESLSVSGDFWVGAKEFSSSQPFGLDNSSNSNNSYQRVGSNGDWTLVEGNLMYRVYLDSRESSGRVVSSWDDEIELTLSKPQPRYTLGFENKKLKRLPLTLNGRQIFRIDNNSGFLSRLNRADEDEFPVVEYDFEDEASGWEHDSGWNLTTSNYAPQSPSHSFNSPNENICSIVAGGSVWPGNTNADSRVNADDLLPIGMYWNQSVCERSENDVYKWEAQPLPESSCISHADSNGDGIVDIADILAIIVNWEKETSNSDGMVYIVDNSCSDLGRDLSRYSRNFQYIYNNLRGSSDPEIQMRHRLEELFGFSSVPNHYQIYQSYPNPFNPIASIPYFLPQESLVALAVYNIAGQKVLTESAFVSTEGYHEIEIDGAELSSGLYFYQFIIDGNELTPMKMVLLK